MTQKERDQILIDLKNSVERHDELLMDLKNKGEEHDKLLMDLKNKGEEHDKLLMDLKNKGEEHDKLLMDLKNKGEEYDNNFKDIRKSLKNLEMNQNELLNKVDRIDRTIMLKVEDEHQDRIQALLDTVSGYPKKFEEIRQKDREQDEKLNLHSDKLFSLNKKVNAY